MVMDSDGGRKERFGDAAAPRVIPKQIEHLAPVIVGAQVFVGVGIAAVVLALAFVEGEPTRILGLVIGLALGILICAAALLLWRRHWAALRGALSTARRTAASNLVLGGRLPQLSSDLREQTWPMSLAPIPRSQHAIVIVGQSGVTVLGVGSPRSVVIHLGWSDIVGIRGVEYVEAGKAYDGIAFVGPTPDRAVIMQPVRLGVAGPRFPRGASIDELAAQLLAQRPTVAEDGPP